VLSPGSVFSIGSSFAAGTITCTILWRERVAEQSELQF